MGTVQERLRELREQEVPMLTILGRDISLASRVSERDWHILLRQGHVRKGSSLNLVSIYDDGREYRCRDRFIVGCGDLNNNGDTYELREAIYNHAIEQRLYICDVSDFENDDILTASMGIIIEIPVGLTHFYAMASENFLNGEHPCGKRK